MPYEDFPRIAGGCPLCGAPECAVYRGYYKRTFVCTEMEFCGPLVVRTGYCRRLGRRFALLPDFLIRRQRMSRLSVERLIECSARATGRQRLQSAIDTWLGGLNEEEYYLPRSTAWTYLKRMIPEPP